MGARVPSTESAILHWEWAKRLENVFHICKLEWKLEHNKQRKTHPIKMAMKEKEYEELVVNNLLDVCSETLLNVIIDILSQTAI